MKLLTKDFFLQDTVSVARSLIGKELVYKNKDFEIGGIINETEAYTQEDPACHAFNGKITKRNKIMFEEAGTIYIYLIYGMYHCLNIVTEDKNRGCAVLIRSIIPTKNIKEIKKNRNNILDKNLTNGPGKLTLALNIPPTLNGVKLSENCPLHVRDNTIYVDKIEETPRIGISENKEALWRFYAPYVTKDV
ncbi:MAG: 3-methyladenine DNA glycosylase [Rickettsiales bacterium]|nr:3-methyladenine DNA glycosylase [Rickettsiales bacterium]